MSAKIFMTADLKTGEIEFGVTGAKGPICLQITKFLQEMGTVTDLQKTNEFWEQTVEVTGTLKTNLCG